MPVWIFALLLAAEPGWEVSGVVKTESGPLKDWWISMRGPEEQARPTKTDSQGRYTFKGSLPGTYTIRVEKPEDASEPRSRTLTLAPGDKLTGVDLLILKGASISGKVLDRSGRPISGLVVFAYVRSHELGHVRLFEKGGALTDDRGEYRIAHLPDAAYLVAAVAVVRKPLRTAKRGPEPAAPLPPAYPPITFAPSGRSHSTAAVVEVQGGEERRGVDITLEKEPVYCIYFKPGSALPQADSGMQMEAILNEWLDTRGPYLGGGSISHGQESQICGLPEGEYRLGLLGFTKSPSKGLGYVQTTVIVSKRHADIGSLDLLDFQSLTGAVAIRGAKPGDPVPEGIRLILPFRNRSLLPSDTFAGKVAPDGTINLAKVYQDTYGLSFENLPKGHYVVKSTQNGRDTAIEGVRPGAGPLQIELASDGPILTGKVLTAGNEPRPVSEVTVFLTAKDGTAIRIAQSDQSGTYTFDSAVAPGDYRIVAVPDLPDSQRRDPTIAQRFLANGVDLKLEAGERKSLDLKLR